MSCFYWLIESIHFGGKREIKTFNTFSLLDCHIDKRNIMRFKNVPSTIINEHDNRRRLYFYRNNKKLKKIN